LWTLTERRASNLLAVRVFSGLSGAQRALLIVCSVCTTGFTVTFLTWASLTEFRGEKMYSFDEIEEAQEKALDFFRKSPYYTDDNVSMYRAVFGVMNSSLPKKTTEDSLSRVTANRMADEPAEPLGFSRLVPNQMPQVRKYGSFGTGS
jgi:hypothetical protein